MSDLLSFLASQKAWWLVPILAMLLAFAALLFLTTPSGDSTFVYTLSP